MDSCKGKVSIIIGLFNVSKYLEEKRLSCILQQTWSNLEILLINDGSADNTSEICQEMANEGDTVYIKGGKYTNFEIAEQTNTYNYIHKFTSVPLPNTSEGAVLL